MTKIDENRAKPEKPTTFWTRVYVSVIAVNIVVILLLWVFSRYFS